MPDRYGIPNSAYYFDGINDNIDVSYTPLNAYESEFSIGMWVNADSIQLDYAKMLCFPQQTDSWESPYHFTALTYSKNTADSLQFNFYYFNQTTEIGGAFTKKITPTTWQFLVSTFNSGSLKLYVDNELVSSATISESQLYFPNHGFSISSRTINDAIDAEFFTGMIDDIRLYNRELGSDEITALYKEGDHIEAINHFRKFRFLPLPLEGIQFLRFESYYSEDSEQVNVYEIEAYHDGTNIGLGKPTIATSDNGSISSQANDGNPDSRWSSDRLEEGPNYIYPHSILIDLEQKIVCDSIVLNIEGWDAWNQSFSLLASPDSINWYLIGSGDDTTGIFSYETNIIQKVTVYDTIFETITDTVTVEIFDTTYVTITDSISVTDTLIINAAITGINPPNNLNTVKVYPNPSSDRIYINTGNYELMDSYQIKIVNQSGTIVFDTIVEDSLYEVNLSSWTGMGLYYIQIINDVGDVIDVRKIILK